MNFVPLDDDDEPLGAAPPDDVAEACEVEPAPAPEVWLPVDAPPAPAAPLVEVADVAGEVALTASRSISLIPFHLARILDEPAVVAPAPAAAVDDSDVVVVPANGIASVTQSADLSCRD